MKILIISALWLFSLVDVCFGVSSEYSWNKIPFLSNVNDSSTLYSIHAFNRNEAIAAGSDGTITYVNADEGIYSPKHCNQTTFHWISFADSLFGWVVGDGGTIYATTDKGATWIQQASGVKTRLNAVACVNRSNVWIAGDSGVILYTSDGGDVWNHSSMLSSFPPNDSNKGDCFDFMSIAINDNAVGCIGGNWRTSREPIILVTCNGYQWTALNITVPNAKELYEIAFKDTMPVAFMNYDHIPDSSGQLINCGSYCVPQVRICESSFYSFRHQYFPEKISYHKIVASGELSTFQEITNQKMYAIDSVDSKTAWIVGAHGACFRTTDAGIKWVSMNDGEIHYDTLSDNLNRVYFYDGQHGFICGNSGKLFSTNDGGKTWKLAISPTYESLSFNDIVFTDSLHGFLVVEQKNALGTPFILQTTTDGGRTWTTSDNYPSEINELRRVNNDTLIGFNSSFKGFYFGWNGGLNWQKQSTQYTIGYNDLYPVTLDTLFITSSTYFARGIFGRILKSTDRGATFDLISSVDYTDAFDKNFNSITFSNPATGWVVGDSGLILKSVDSGYTWQRQPSPTTDVLTKIRFYNPSFGWTFGGSKIFLTSDGGATWQDKSILTSTKVSDVVCSDPENCWAVGDNGLILHLSNKNDKFIEITYPDKNTVLAVSDSFTVKWKIVGKSQVAIAVSYDNGQNYTVYRAATDDDGAETIRISANATASTICKVRIRDLEQTMQGESENFTIVSNSLSVNKKITFPLETGCHISGSSITYTLVEDAVVSLKVFTFSGRQVHWQSCAVKRKGISVEQLPLKQLPGGCYLLRVSIGGRVFTRNLYVHR